MYFCPDQKTKAPVGVFNEGGGDGRVFIKAVAHANLTAKQPYMVIMDQYGNVTKALGAGAFYCYIGVPDRAYAAGEIATLQVGGFCAAMLTASFTGVINNALRVVAGAVAQVAAPYSGLVAEFAVQKDNIAGTAHDVMLCGRQILTLVS